MVLHRGPCGPGAVCIAVRVDGMGLLPALPDAAPRASAFMYADAADASDVCFVLPSFLFAGYLFERKKDRAIC